MSQFKLVSVHSLGRGVLWHNLWGAHHRAVPHHCTEDYFVRLFWHFMRFPRGLGAVRALGGLRPVWGNSPARAGESFLLSCHLLCYQDWLLCFMTYLYARGESARVASPSTGGLHNFLWACSVYHGGPAAG
jgi:hypothetical protein